MKKKDCNFQPFSTHHPSPKLPSSSRRGWNIFDFFLVVFSFSEVAISRLLVLNQPNDNENSASLNVGYLEKGEGDGLMWFKHGLWMAWHGRT